MAVETLSVPVIDLADAVASSVSEDLLGALKEATETFGVIQVVNHGVPEHLIGEFDYRVGRPRDRQAELPGTTGHQDRGWRRWRDHVQPGDDQELRDLAFRYMSASHAVAERVLRLYGLAQGLPAGTFRVSPLPYLSFTVNSYPVWTYPDTGNEEDKLLLLERAEDSAVRILAQGGDCQGLQVQLPGGDWLPVPVVPGALQVFSGTLLTRWTNGLLRPARHRVVTSGTATRRFVGMFYYPGLEQVVEPLPPFAGPEGR